MNYYSFIIDKGYIIKSCLQLLKKFIIKKLSARACGIKENFYRMDDKTSIS